MLIFNHWRNEARQNLNYSITTYMQWVHARKMVPCPIKCLSSLINFRANGKIVGTIIFQKSWKLYAWYQVFVYLSLAVPGKIGASIDCLPRIKGENYSHLPYCLLSVYEFFFTEIILVRCFTSSEWRNGWMK